METAGKSADEIKDEYAMKYWYYEKLGALDSRQTCKSWAACSLSNPELLICSADETRALQPASTSKGWSLVLVFRLANCLPSTSARGVRFNVHPSTFSPSP